MLQCGLTSLLVLIAIWSKKNPQTFVRGFFRFCLDCSGRSKIGIVILSQALGQVPSAQVGLTSLFGMGRGDPHRYRRHKGITSYDLGFSILDLEPILVIQTS